MATDKQQKWNATRVPDQTGRTAVVTGANSGIGLRAAQALAGAGAHVVFAVRDPERGEAAARTVNGSTEVRRLDLADLSSVREFAAGWDRPLDLLINNAGVMMVPQQRTADGFEMQFGTNHLGHFAFTGLLLDRLLAVPGSRVVTVSSVGHRFARNGIRFGDLQWEKDYSRVGAYGQAKLANLMFTYELQRRLQGTNTIAAAAHPGGSRTELTRNLPRAVELVSSVLEPLYQGPDMGALPQLRAATDPGVIGGQYFGPDGFAEQRGYPVVVASSRASHDVDAQRRLWTVSEELTGVTFPVPALV
jgi:NAD(P)-dependent dehydrogenase (short-subunit alcohol dehydrogenase family)